MNYASARKSTARKKPNCKQRRSNYLVTFILMPYENIFVDFPETFLQFTWVFVEEQESSN
jgi:hypothetical protein